MCIYLCVYVKLKQFLSLLYMTHTDSFILLFVFILSLSNYFIDFISHCGSLSHSCWEEVNRASSRPCLPLPERARLGPTASALDLPSLSPWVPSWPGTRALKADTNSETELPFPPLCPPPGSPLHSPRKVATIVCG